MTTGPIELQTLIAAGSFIGGAIAGLFSAKRFPGLATESRIEKSQKTSGARHISEEGRDKMSAMETLLKTEYLTESKHTTLCTQRVLEIKLLISQELKGHTKEILDAIKNNGNGCSAK